jgi:replicative DNA helicase
MDISAIVLNKLLASKDLDSFARLKLCYLDPAYNSVFTAISKHYSKYSEIPGFDDLDMSMREGLTKNTLEAIRLTEDADVSIEVAIDSLIDQYTQSEFLRLIDRMVDKVTFMDTEEIKSNLSDVLITLDEKTMTTEGITVMDSFLFFQQEDEISRNRVMMGINNDFDAAIGGMARQEYLMIGGKRGSGKSLISANICANQYEIGNVCPYFSIEMTGRETTERIMAILANVDYQNIKHGRSTPEELLAIIKVRAGMFLDADDLVEEFKVHRDKFKFENELVRTKVLKPDNQLIVIDDRALSLSKLDIHLGKLKAKFGDKLTSCVVDYVNQVRLDSGSGKTFSQYDWQPQVVVSTGLKNLARKYDLVMIAPYQVDETGEARFGKGILDSADIALKMEVYDKSESAMGMTSTKIRGASDQTFISGMNWTTLRMSPVSVEPPAKKEKPKKEKHAKEPVDDSQGDAPW